MSSTPLVLGLTLCEDVVADPATRNVSVIRAFTGLAVAQFPTTAPPFCAFASLTDGLGPTDLELLVTEMAGDCDVIYRLRRSVAFADPLQIVNFVVRLARCPLPRPGIYLFTLQSAGEWLAQRSLRAYLAEEAT